MNKGFMNETQRKSERSNPQKGSLQVDRKKIENLIDILKNKDGMKRRKARFALEKIGKAATPYLMEALSDKIEACRWEVAKTLITIKDPKAAEVYSGK